MACYEVCSETGADGIGLAWIPDLPGCAAPWPAEPADIAATITRHLEWMRRWGEPVPGHWFEIELDVVETQQHRATIARTGPRALFGHDRRPLTTRLLYDTLRFLDHSRRTLLEHLSDDDPDRLSLRTSAGGWTVNQHLRHVATVERWCIGRLGRLKRLPTNADTLERLAEVRELVVDRLTSMSAVDRFKVVEVAHETWSARKIIRRLIWHELHHSAAINTVLTTAH